MKLRSVIFIVLLVFLFFEIWIGFPVHLETADRRSQSKSLGEQIDKKMEGMHVVETQGGHRDWELLAEKAESFAGKGKEQWILKNVKVLFYNDNKVQFTMTGESGKIESNRNLSVEGKVITQSANGYRFETPSAYYNSKQRIIYSPDKVKMVGPPDEKGKGIQLQGQKMETLVDENLMKIQENVRAKKVLNDGKEIFVESKRGEFSSKSNHARFVDDVTIRYNTMKIEGPEANFQYKDGTDFLQSMLIKGGARVTDIDKMATAESVNFDPNLNRFVLRGLPRVVQNDDEILGDEIVFIDGGKRVKVEKLKAHVKDTEGNTK